MPDLYTNPLSLTSQFFFCGLPLRLDSYRGCAFQCSFCYARYRGGNTPDTRVTPADPLTLRRILDRALADPPHRGSGLLGQFLRRRVPIHFGGMSDPFQPAERRHRVTQAYLEALRDHGYPTVISTRSTIVAEAPYLQLLREMRVVVQFSFSSTRQDLSNRLEPHSPEPADLMRTMEVLSAAGILVTCRWQPYVPGAVEPIPEFVRRIAATGARHVAIEHLKLPLESRHPLTPTLERGPLRHVRAEYAASGARRDGREYVLPAETKLPGVLEFRRAVRAAGMSVGIADNELQYLSDSACCCSGVDQFAGFEGWFKHQVGHAVRLCRGERIIYGAISGFWTPDGAADRWVNSRSRIGDKTTPGSVTEHIRRRWNDVTSPFSPSRFYGVSAADEFTSTGHRVYVWNTHGRRLLLETRPAPLSPDASLDPISSR